jgi:hypothetical protein
MADMHDGSIKNMAEGLNAEYTETAGLLKETENIELSGANKGWPAVIGDRDFVRSAMARHQHLRAHRLHRQADYLHTLETLAAATQERFSLAPNEWTLCTPVDGIKSYTLNDFSNYSCAQGKTRGPMPGLFFVIRHTKKN